MPDFLSHYYPNADFSPPERQELLGLHTLRQAGRGEVLLDIGQRADHFWVVWASAATLLRCPP